MRKRKYFIIIGIIGIVLSIVAWEILQAYRTTLIVEFGITGANTAKIPIIALISASFISVLIGMPEVLKAIKQNFDKKKLQVLGSQYRSKKSGPEEIREQLELMMNQRTELSGKINLCISQLDAIEQQQNKFNRLIKINEASALSSAKEALEETQFTICSNFKWIINSNIAASEIGQIGSIRLSENIDEVLEVNKTLLDKDEEFLQEIANHLSQVKGEGHTFQLDAWRETIRNLNKKSLKR